jgi:hypothetical protein
VLPDQLFRVLAMLVRERGSLVGRDELRRVLWPDDTFVDFEHGLNAAIKRLREVLRGAVTASSLRPKSFLRLYLLTVLRPTNATRPGSRISESRLKRDSHERAGYGC